MLTFFSEHFFVLWNLSIYLGQRGGEGRGVGLPESPPQTVERWARDGLSPRFYINQMYNAAEKRFQDPPESAKRIGNGGTNGESPPSAPQVRGSQFCSTSEMTSGDIFLWSTHYSVISLSGERWDRDLPKQATLLSPRSVTVSLVGVEQLEGWGEEHMERMKCLLHMKECTPTPTPTGSGGEERGGR